MKRIKRLMVFCLAAGFLAFAGCAQAGETAAEIEEIRGPEPSASEPLEETLTGDEAVKRAETFLEGIAPGVFGVSLRAPEPVEADGHTLYLLNLQAGGSLDSVSYEPTLAVDAGSGILYSYYQDGTVIPAAEDELWLTFDAAAVEEMTPEEQASLAEAESYASEMVDDGEAAFVLPLKTGQYVYGDETALYVGYAGETVQTFAHEGTPVTPDETTLLARDVNFDGNEDLLLNTSAGAPNAYYLLWLFDPAEGTFYPYEGFEALASPTVNASAKEITTYERGSAADFTQAVWRWDDYGALQQVSRYAVVSDESGNVTVSETAADGTESSFTVTADQYAAASELMAGAAVDFCISRYGGSDSRTFTFEGMQTVNDVSCYSILVSEGGEPAVRLYIDASATYMVMLDEDCDGTPEETANMQE